MEVGGWPSSTISTERRVPFQFIPARFSFFFMAPSRRFSATEKGKARQVEPTSPPPKRGRGRPRKHPVATSADPRGQGDDFQRGNGRIAVAGGARSGRASP